MSGSLKIKAVVFDVGETLINEDRMWQGWAAYLDVSIETLLAALNAVIAERGHHWDVLRNIKPGLDVKAAITERLATGERMTFDQDDLCADALPCLTSLRDRGYKVGIVGNQTAQSEAAIADCGFELDFVGSSAGWGVEKPSPEFFVKIQQIAGIEAGAIAYVGDLLDNDILPASKVGMVGVFIERGPWGRLHATWPEIDQASVRVQSLLDIPDALGRYRP
ncbi:MAG: HAD family hydrolase [Alphaproteobacteria bacterium]|nr:HAD family hydrolase [Alphaproteobacteria bacterium]